MRGTISAIAPDGTYGQIAAADGQRYSYWTSEVRNGRPHVGQTADFKMWEGQPVEIFLLAAPAPPDQPPRQRAAAPQQMAYAPAGYAHAAPAAYAVAVGPSSPAQYWIKLFTSPFGRISRRQFWLHGVLPIVVASVLVGWIPIVGTILMLVVWWASICVSFKRFHDLGYPGWWSLINVIPMVAALALTVGSIFTSGFAAAWLLAQILWGAAFVIFIVQLIFVYLRVGQQGPNAYDEDPLASP